MGSYGEMAHGTWQPMKESEAFSVNSFEARISIGDYGRAGKSCAPPESDGRLCNFMASGDWLGTRPRT